MAWLDKEKARAYRSTHREEARAYASAYYVAHREEKRSYNTAYSAAHKDEIRACGVAWRESHPDYGDAHRAEKRERDARQQRWFIGNLRILRAAQGCDDCGTSEGLLDHHHTDPSTKTYSVSQMYNNSLEAFMDEIAKCTVLCRSCHKKRH